MTEVKVIVEKHPDGYVARTVMPWSLHDQVNRLEPTDESHRIGRYAQVLRHHPRRR